MLLSDILHTLLEEIEDFNYTNQEFYELLFLQNETSGNLDLEDTVKKIFSNTKSRRALSGEITKKFRSRKGFLDFSAWIEKSYLSKINYQNRHLYNRLCEAIKTCPYMPDNYKKELLGNFNPDNSFQLAELIASCIILSNYNTRQTKSKSPSVKDKYKLSLRFTGIPDSYMVDAYPLTDRLWTASQRSFQYSRQDGNRFQSLNIIKYLLPKGCLADTPLQLRAKVEDGSITSITEICKNTKDDLVIIGEGGIGKTTFLQQILEESFLIDHGFEKEYLSFRQGYQVPIFIELNRCPLTVGDWYDPLYKKTNFITRYVAQILENHSSLDAVEKENLTALEKEFQKIPDNGVPQYLLLLDGFNEVSTSASAKGKSVRSYLSDEISSLHTYPNVRIITTSRETQSAAFMQSFRNIRLLGIEDSDITTYLEECGMSATSIDITMANRQLVTCLRVPLFLCMFASGQEQGELLPETSGEILYFFFHKNSAFYNTRQRSDDTRTNPLSAEETAVILDFVLPYIGWYYENADTFSVVAHDFEALIKDSLETTQRLFLSSESIPFEDFHADKRALSSAVSSLIKADGTPRTEDIILCIHSYLGILYYYSDFSVTAYGQARYSFIHHHFRDYFSSIFDVQVLRMLPYISPSIFIESDALFPQGSYHYYLNRYYWQSNKVAFISQILMEHRNKPYMDTMTQNWQLPAPFFPEQTVFTKALDFCRILVEAKQDIHYLLQNILSAMVYGREELSGLDLSRLDFKGCSLFHIPCSKHGATKTLAAIFNQSALYTECFEPVNHLNDIIEYVYHGNNCYSLDQSGTIKCWDVLSGKPEYTLQSESPEGIQDFSSRGFMKISGDGHWLAIKVQPEIPTDQGAYIAVFDLFSRSKEKSNSLVPPQKCKALTSFSFTEDMKSILLLADCHQLYCFCISDGTLEYEAQVDAFLTHTDIYAKDSSSPVFAFTCEYNEFELAYTYADAPESFSEQFDNDDEWEEHGSTLEIPCFLLHYSPVSKETKELYHFISTPGTLPAAEYFYSINCFLLYNYASQQIEKFDCDFLTAEPVWENIVQQNGMPSFILPSAVNPQECYVMYPDICYEMDLFSEQEEGIITAYSVEPMNRLLTEYEIASEDGLRFLTATIPSKSRILVRSDLTVYEWNTINDSLSPRYNSVYYGSTGFIADTMHNRSILVHQYNGVSVFGEDPERLIASYCFPYTDYCLENCIYHANTQQLALCFYRPGHEFITILSLRESSSRIVFSVMQNDFTESMNFSADGSCLLICTLDSCLEYNSIQGTLCTVASVDENESFIGADYVENEIEITVVERKSFKEPHIIPRCDYYTRYKHGVTLMFKRTWGYYVPALPKDLAAEFVHLNQDTGTGGSFNTNGIQSYWLTRGFFKSFSDQIGDFLTLSCFEYKNQTRRKTAAKKWKVCQFLYVMHEFCIDDPQRANVTNYCYSYLSDDFSKAVCIRDYAELYLWEDLKNEPDKLNFFDYKGTEYRHAYWDYAIPTVNNQLLCCFENYRLIHVDASNGNIHDEIEYTPGIAISGCKFKSVIADEETKHIIRCNGGLIV